MPWKTIIMRILMVILGIIIGGVLAVITTFVLIAVEENAIQTTVNGWSTTLKCDLPGMGILLRAACASELPMANVPEEAMYWTAIKDSLGQKLNGQHDYVLHFPPGGTPPNDAFWSLTMTDIQSHMWPIRSTATVSSTHRAWCRTPMAQLTFISRARLRPVTSRTGCRRQPVTSSCGCARIYPARQFSMVNTPSHRSPK